MTPASYHYDQCPVCSDPSWKSCNCLDIIYTTHSKLSSASCNTFLLNSNNPIDVTSNIVWPTLALNYSFNNHSYVCLSVSILFIYTFSGSHAEVLLFDGVPCL